MVAIAGCDADCTFKFWTCCHTGSTNDALAITGSHGGRILMGSSLPEVERPQEQLPQKYYGVGDDAFTNCNTLLAPWPGQHLDIWKDSFNFHLSAMRQCIERAFGLMMRRWGIFHRWLEVSLKKWGFVTAVCAKLHNYCIRRGLGEPPPHYTDDVEDGDAAQVISNKERGKEARQRGAQRPRRQALTDALKAAGQAQPEPPRKRARRTR